MHVIPERFQEENLDHSMSSSDANKHRRDENSEYYTHEEGQRFRPSPPALAFKSI
jgi:hypothetical protein